MVVGHTEIWCEKCESESFKVSSTYEKRNDTLMEIIFKELKALDVIPSSLLTIALQVFSFSWVCFSSVILLFTLGHMLSTGVPRFGKELL